MSNFFARKASRETAPETRLADYLAATARSTGWQDVPAARARLMTSKPVSPKSLTARLAAASA